MIRHLIFGIAFILSHQVYAAPVARSSSYILDDLQTEVNNHTTEIRIIEEKLKNQLIILESIRDQVHDNTQSQKDMVKNSSVSLENRILALESSIKSITADLKQMQTHANETANALKQYKQKIADQGDSIDTIQKTLKTLLEAMQVTAAPSSSGKTYIVQSGDSLGAIAKRNKTTIKEISNLNNLQNEKIFVGQTLKLP